MPRSSDYNPSNDDVHTDNSKESGKNVVPKNEQAIPESEDQNLALGKPAQLLENGNAYPPEVLSLLDVIHDVIISALASEVVE